MNTLFMLALLLDGNNDIKHLVLETNFGNHEVKHGDLDTNLR
jgi:hypothetical protein